MKTLLQLNASIFSHDGQSSRLADEFVATWRARNPGAKVTVRDFARDPVPHLDAARFRAFLTKAEERSAGQQAVADYSDALIEELRRADVIVLGLPMYNFGVPSTLKAYFDHIARAGVTFRYTEKGSEGLLTAKKAYVVAARGGVYMGTPLDMQTAYVRHFLHFVGIEDVEFIYAEGLNISEESKQAGLAGAHDAIRRLGTPERIAA
jgi:FMN-dependent NADH-azoreductase